MENWAIIGVGRIILEFWAFGQFGLCVGHGSHIEKGKKVVYPSLDSLCELGSNYWFDDYFVINSVGILAGWQPKIFSVRFDSAR